MLLTLTKVRMSCRDSSCNATFVFDWQPRSGLWKLNKLVEHTNDCGRQTVGEGQFGDWQRSTSAFCASAYLPRQVARSVIGDVRENPNFTARTIADIVKAKGIYSRQPSPQHFRSVRREIQKQLAANRCVDMASMSGYMQLLRAFGHKAELITISGREMKDQRVKAAKFIFEQKKKAKHIEQAVKFDPNIVNLDDIEEDGKYYGGFTFVSSLAEVYCTSGRRTAAADAAHCEGKGPQSYGTTFEVVTYDTNNHLLPVFFGHFVGAECHQYWKTVFDCVKTIPGFDVPDRTTIVDQEKCIDSAYYESMEHAHLFLDPTHVKKNMGPKLGAEKSTGLLLYERAVYAPSTAVCESIIAQYGKSQTEYLAKFKKSQLYRSYSKLEDTITCSQGAESAMSSSLRNDIRTVEPQRMLEKLLLLQRTGFLKRQQSALNNANPLPPRMEKYVGSLILQSREYQTSVKFTDGGSKMEAHVTSKTDGSKHRHVIMPTTPQVPPRCCAYSQLREVFLCHHGCAVIGEKHGYANLHLFVNARHLSAAWKRIYENVSFPIPIQADIDNIRTEEKLSVVMGTNVKVPKALPPPRGRPCRNAGKRKEGFYKRGPAAKRVRSYYCSICHQDVHTAPDCSLRQLFPK